MLKSLAQVAGWNRNRNGLWLPGMAFGGFGPACCCENELCLYCTGGMSSNQYEVVFPTTITCHFGTCGTKNLGGTKILTRHPTSLCYYFYNDTCPPYTVEYKLEITDEYVRVQLHDSSDLNTWIKYYEEEDLDCNFIDYELPFLGAAYCSVSSPTSVYVSAI
jgi:hypothetical protein